ncbi:MAG: electron transport complex subunit G [Cycloclasticus sp. symbiont of Bathymodiolus heckerae]|nr:MAG: electron transport complex subunit G [Cycloclasticus sp. symbiont of Bathymodiolus heckerae]
MSDSRSVLIKSGWVLGLFSFIGIGLVSLTYSVTHEKIAENERLFILKNLRELVPGTLHDNDLLADTLQIAQAKEFAGKHPVTIYRALKNKKLVAIIAAPTAPDGYNGSIKLLVAIKENGELIGVRAVSHHETPGLGDAIDTNKSDWIHAFNGRSLSNPPIRSWHVKKDGGDFDQFTGATVTPRAVVKAVLKTLQYYQANHSNLAKIDG